MQVLYFFKHSKLLSLSSLMQSYRSILHCWVKIRICIRQLHKENDCKLLTLQIGIWAVFKWLVVKREIYSPFKKPMTTSACCPTKLSQVEANTCNRRQARANACDVTIGFCVTFDWSRNWREIFNQLWSKVKPKQMQITVDTHLKPALNQPFGRNKFVVHSTEFFTSLCLPSDDDRRTGWGANSCWLFLDSDKKNSLFFSITCIILEHKLSYLNLFIACLFLSLG